MGNECCDEKCCSESCQCSCEETNDISKEIMQLADKAWEELMKEKMKAAYEKAIGERMNKVAQVGIEASIAYWGSKMKAQSSWAEFEEKLRKAMA